jgi:putative ABC transport system permease protein
LKRENREFTISGVLETSLFGGPSPFQNDVLIPSGSARELGRLPFSSIWDLFRFRDGVPGYSAVNVRLASLRDLESVKSRVEEMGFATFALADQFEEIKRSWVYVDMFLAAVGMIAIVVAALGITNTMVMSILERYREIGIMKAVGAADGDVRGIFFFESAAIGLLGGVLGFGLGWTVSRIINRVVNFYTARLGIPETLEYFAFPLWLFLGALGFSVLVSLAAGIYPAGRAARIDPVAALRHD